MDLADLPLIGRENQVERGNRILDGESGGVVIDGRSGVGKTRLARELLGLARSRGFATTEVRVASDRESPAALADLLGDEGSPPDDPLALLVRLRAAISRLRQDRPLALAIDDAHLLDEVSAVLTEQLVADGEAFVIVTVESGKRAPDPIVRLWKDGRVDRMELAPLDAPSMDDLIAAMLGGLVDPAAKQLLANLAAGNLRLLRDLIGTARERDGLRLVAGKWRVVGDIPLPPEVTERVDLQLSQLTPAERELLQALANGGRLELAAVAALGTTASLDALERQSVLTVERDRQRMYVRITDPLVGEVVRRRTPADRAVAVNRRLAEWMAAAGCRRSEDDIRAVLWRLEGDGPVAADELVGAARQARDRGSVAVARQLARAAMSAGGGFEAELLVAELGWLDGDLERADASLRLLATQSAGEDQRIRAALQRVQVLAVGFGRLADAMAITDGAMEAAVDHALSAQVALARAEVLLVGGRVHACLDVARPLLLLADVALVARAGETVAEALAHAGRPGDALTLLDHGRATAPAELTVRTTTATVLALTTSGRLREAEDLAGQEHRAARARRDRAAELQLAGTLAWIHLLRGRAGAASRLSARARAIARDIGHREPENQAVGQLALALAFSGDAEAATATLTEAGAGDGGPVEGRSAWLLARAKAWVAAAEGRLPDGLALLRQVAFDAGRAGDILVESLALHDVARLGAPNDAADRLVVLSKTTDSDLVDVAAMHAVGLAEGDPEQIEQASHRLETAGMWLPAAEAAAQGAAALGRRREPRRAAALLRRASDLAQRCDGAATPALAGVTTDANLTARQLEIARLAAGGLANRAIAERLYLSVRTVETQLQRVYQRLGVDRRSDLRRALGSGDRSVSGVVGGDVQNG